MNRVCRLKSTLAVLLLSRASSQQAGCHPAPLLEGGPGVPTFLEEPPGPEEGVPQQQAGPRALLEAGVQPPHQRVDGGVAEAEGGRGEHVGDGGVHAGVIAPVGTHMLPKGLGAQDPGDVIAQRDDLRTKESWWEPGPTRGPSLGHGEGLLPAQAWGPPHPRVVFGGHATCQGRRRQELYLFQINSRVLGLCGVGSETVPDAL